MPAPEIEKGIAIPPKNRKRALYPWEGMEVNDSFSVMAKPDQPIKSLQSLIMTAGRSYFKKRNIRAVFTSRTITKNKLRIWRVA